LNKSSRAVDAPAFTSGVSGATCIPHMEGPAISAIEVAKVRKARDREETRVFELALGVLERACKRT